MQSVRDAWQAPPDFFEPLITLANIAARTSVLRLTTGILVLPMRQPVLVAKQVATLDQLSHGRVILGVSIGGDRGGFEKAGSWRGGRAPAEGPRGGRRAPRGPLEPPV